MRIHEILNENRRRSWTDDEVKKLITMYSDEKMSQTAIAQNLGRPISGVLQKLDRLFPDREKQDHRPFTADEVKKLITMYSDEKMSQTAIAQNLGRPISGVLQKLNQLFPDREKRDQRAWTDDEVEKLITMYSDEKMSITAIAQNLGRSKNVVRMKLNQLFPDREKRDQRAWTDDEVEKLITMYSDEKMSLTAIAQNLGRDQTVVHMKLDQLFPDREKRDQRAWTDDEVEKLITMYSDEKMSQTAIAQNLGRSRNVVLQKLDQLFPNREKQDHRPFTADEVDLIRQRFKEGYGYTAIGFELERYSGNIRTVIKRQEDYDTVLLPPHLENLQSLSQTSQQEINFFNTLGEELKTRFHNSNIEIKRNVRLSRGGRLFYNVDGLAEKQQLVIEFFGTLYHADPIVYPDPNQFLHKLSCTAGEVRKHDQKKINWLTNKYGNSPVIVWEREWRKKSTKQECIDRVLTRLGLI